MSSEFYDSILQEETRKFDVSETELKFAAKSVSINYSKKSLKNGTTDLDYNEPENRCAYLYKYGTLHTGLVTKYFRKLVRKKQIKKALMKKGKIKICCLGGGPGTDVVGLFKALAIMPCFTKRISQVWNLDICKGWEETFNLIMENLMENKVEGVPETFVNKEKFKWLLKEVDLLDELPKDVKEIISSADVVCMVKFVSAILAKDDALVALKTLGSFIKKDAVVFFIDNFQGSIFEPVESVSKCIGLETVMGPLHEVFVRLSKSSLEVYGCKPQTAAKVSVIGWIKSTNALRALSNKFLTNSSLSIEACNWESESESRPSSVISSVPYLDDDQTQETVPSVSNNATQTDPIVSQSPDLSELFAALTDLVTIMEKMVVNKEPTRSKHIFATNNF